MSDRISPTAHYTNQAWLRAGLAPSWFGTAEGKLLHATLQPAMLLSQRLGGPTLMGFLEARHRAIDAMLEQAIERDGICQIVEVAAGLSARGWRFNQRYGDRIRYIETDLPNMVSRKRALLEPHHTLNEHHQVRSVDALAESGEDSLMALCHSLDPSKGLVIITEGLVNYFDTDSVLALWRNFSHSSQRFNQALYLSDMHLKGTSQGLLVNSFRLLLSSFVRGKVSLHFENKQEAQTALVRCGFQQAQLHEPNSLRDMSATVSSRLVNVIVANNKMENAL